jgi:TolA-binding protein
MFNRLMILLFSAFFIASLFNYCGTSRKEGDDDSTEEEARQKELDEIEALLGITREESDAQKKEEKPAQDDDMLGLLKSDQVPLQEQPEVKPKTQPVNQKELNDLKAEVEKKNLLIADLKAQIRNQSDRIYELESQKQRVTPMSAVGGLGDVPPGEYGQRYQQAFDQFQAQNYKESLQMFESLLASDANNSLSDNAQYWIGECNYAMRQYKKAIIDFEKVFTFTNSNKNDAAQFKLGLCYLRLGDNSKAREEFQRLLDVFPESEYISRARDHLATL